MRISPKAMVSAAAVLAGSAAGVVAWALTASGARARWRDVPDGFAGFNEWFEVVRWVIPASAAVAVIASLVALALIPGAGSVRSSAAMIAAVGVAGWVAGWIVGFILAWAGPVVPITLPAVVVAAGAWGLARPREPLAASA